MIEGHIIFNAILYSIVIAYILYINFSAYYQTGTGFLKALVNLFQNWIFRTVYLLIVGFFALDLFPYGGFVLAILLTIAFLNTNMLVYKKDVEESMVGSMNNLPSDGTDGANAQKETPLIGNVGGNSQTGPDGGTTQKETPLIGNVGVNSQTRTVGATAKTGTPPTEEGTVSGTSKKATSPTRTFEATAQKNNSIFGTGTGNVASQVFPAEKSQMGQMPSLPPSFTTQQPQPPSFATQQQ
jgi:hypothetical protein